MTTTSTSLLMRLREPTDREAWTKFVRLYGPLIYKWAARTGLNADDAADLVQDVMLLLVRKLPSFRYDQSRSFRAWLKTITMNKWRDKGRRKSLPVSPATLSGLARLPEEEATDIWEVEYRRQLVTQAMNLLRDDFKPKTWEACFRYISAGEKPEALAEELGISVWTIYSAKSRIVRRLREDLDGMLE